MEWIVGGVFVALWVALGLAALWLSRLPSARVGFVFLLNIIVAVVVMGGLPFLAGYCLLYTVDGGGSAFGAVAGFGIAMIPLVCGLSGTSMGLLLAPVATGVAVAMLRATFPPQSRRVRTVAWHVGLISAASGLGLGAMCCLPMGLLEPVADSLKQGELVGAAVAGLLLAEVAVGVVWLAIVGFCTGWGSTLITDWLVYRRDRKAIERGHEPPPKPEPRWWPLIAFVGLTVIGPFVLIAVSRVLLSILGGF